MNYFKILLFLAFCQCTHFSNGVLSQTEHPPLLENAVHLQSQKKFSQAEAEVQNYLLQTEDLYWQGAAILLLAEIQEAKEESGTASTALETYKKLLNHGAGYETHHVAKALYKMSWIYERQTNYQGVVATLTDLQNVLKRGDDFIKTIETPARLSNCYYLLGYWARANELRESAEKTFKFFEKNKVPQDVFWRTHLYLNFVGMKKLNTPENYIPSSAQSKLELNSVVNPTATDRHLPEVIRFGQKNLLYVIEQAPNPFNVLADDRLVQEYQDLFEIITNKPKPKTAVDKNANHQALAQELANFIDLIEELKTYKSTGELNPQNTDTFFLKIKNLEERSRKIVKDLPLGLQKEKPTQR